MDELVSLEGYLHHLRSLTGLATEFRDGFVPGKLYPHRIHHTLPPSSLAIVDWMVRLLLGKMVHVTVLCARRRPAAEKLQILTF
jgi:hypothetical protein